MIAATIVARNYVAQARVLAASFLLHHSGDRFVTLVIDGEEQDRSTTGVGSVVLPRDLGLPEAEWQQMVAIYDVMELATAVKPALLRWLLRSGSHGRTSAVLYLDPDVVVYHPFGEVLVAATRSGIALTPHVLHPLQRDDREPTEQTLMLAGLFNLGFICVSRRALDFLDWWHDRLRIDAVVDPAKGLFTDQRWVDWVPSLFGAEVLRDHGLNVAYWNVHERPVTRREDGTLLAGADVLKFFHFSGFDPERPWQLSKHAPTRPRCHLSEHPLVGELCTHYAAALHGAGYAEQRREEYRFGRIVAGVTMTPTIRSAYRSGLKDSFVVPTLAPPPPPFGPDGGAAFAAWLAEPVLGPAEHRISRWQHHLWLQRPDLRAAFPDPSGHHAPQYRHWLEHDPGAIELQAAADLPILQRSGGWQAATTPSSVPGRAAEPFGYGWNVVGYHSAELGVGEAGRRIQLAFEHAGIPSELVAVSAPRSRQEHRLRRKVHTEVVHRRSLYCVNADRMAAAVVAADPTGRSVGRGASGRRIGVWFWELDRFPSCWFPMFDLVDEVWCASEFTADAIRSVSPVPVQFVPLAVLEPVARSPYTRIQLGLPESFVFLCMYDFHSVFGRKNPMGALGAYLQAFGPEDGASLVLKSINGQDDEVALDRLRQAAGGRPDVLVIDGYLDARLVQGLIERADCFVSLHRSEGFGLNLAAAMAAGTPVIATAYSGNLAYMDDDSSLLVPYRLVPVGPGHDPYPPDASWADPDLETAAGFMRRVFDDRDEAAAIGARGRATVLRRNSIDRSAATVAALTLEAEPWWLDGASLPAGDAVLPAGGMNP